LGTKWLVKADERVYKQIGIVKC